MDIVEKAESYVFHLFKDKLSPNYIYHNFNHTLRVAHSARLIAKGEGVSAEDTETLMLAAWFHDTGYIEGPEEHEKRGGALAEIFLKENGYAEGKTEIVKNLIMATVLTADPQNELEKIIKDADCAHFADVNYVALSELLREEWGLTQNKKFTDLEWVRGNRKMLLYFHRYFTNYAKETLQPLKEANVAVLQASIMEMESEDAEPKKRKKDKKDKQKDKEDKLEKPERGIDTMFKITLSNHTRLSDIADSKANILLSVNAIIISISLSTLIPKLDSPANAHLIVPTFIMLMFSVVSIIFAILSTKPKVTSGTFTRKDIEDRKVNLLFFGNFYKMPLDEYQWAVNDMMKDRDYLYNSMIKDLYYLGLVLHRKYALLRTTYTVFMIGIIISVIAFVYAFISL